uniref:Uncharacterized protein n=1 Tax=Oryza punctata TaxID=4537 RepID=A0A0E0JHC2_ORYPU
MNSRETMETRLTTSWMLIAPPKASMRLPKSTVMNGSAAPLATAPSVPSTISAASVLSANANSLWNGTRAATAAAARSPLAAAPPPLPFPGLESAAATEADGAAAAEAFASASLQDSGMASSSLPPLTNQDSKLFFLLAPPLDWAQQQPQRRAALLQESINPT